MVNIKIPYTEQELIARENEYETLSDKQFAKKFRNLAFREVDFKFNNDNNIHSIQMNFCTNPFCKWFGLPQKKYTDIRGKPSRYKFEGVGDFNRGVNLKCNPDRRNITGGVALNCNTLTVSNWAVADEINRLVKVSSLESIVDKYNFHKDNCIFSDSTPFTNKDKFYRKGKSTAGSDKYQCKKCRKITNVLPNYTGNHTYHLKKKALMTKFTKLVVNRTPVRRTCEILNMNPKTYYHRLELLYKKCLEFNHKHEGKFKDLSFDEMWINTDSMIYYLNNVRRKGKGGTRHIKMDKTNFPTYLVASSDMNTNYVFRADIGYDYYITLDDIDKQTISFKDDHSHGYLRKYQRLRKDFSFAPQPPTPKDSEREYEYLAKHAEFLKREDYIEGLHSNVTYTLIAHQWLIKNMINSKKWYLVSDDDNSIKTAGIRVFKDEIYNGNCEYFLCRTNRDLNKEDAYYEYLVGRKELRQWAKDNNITNKTLEELAVDKLASDLQEHKLIDFKEVNGVRYLERTNNPITHPIPSKDKGFKMLDSITNTYYIANEDLAKILVKVDNRSIDGFFGQVRRRISILERPLVTARGIKKKLYLCKLQSKICSIYNNYP